MIYIIAKVVENNSGYKLPDGGKFYINAERAFLNDNKAKVAYSKRTGLGHEEWNFNFDLVVDGMMRGYHYYKPATSKQSEKFTIYFVSYKEKRWRLVGVYRNARFDNTDSYSPKRTALQNIAKKILQLGRKHEVGCEWKNKNEEELINELKICIVHRHWLVAKKDIVIPKEPIYLKDSLKIARNFRTNFHETKPTEISYDDACILDSFLPDYQNISAKEEISLTPSEQDLLNDTDAEAIEGKQSLRTHLVRERNNEIVRQKKRYVMHHNHGRLECEVCGFDFSAIYGALGHSFCEVHHKIPLATKKSPSKTKLNELAIVCSNCHRMLHKGGGKNEVLSIQKLRNILNHPKNET